MFATCGASGRDDRNHGTVDILVEGQENRVRDSSKKQREVRELLEEHSLFEVRLQVGPCGGPSSSMR